MNIKINKEQFNLIESYLNNSISNPIAVYLFGSRLHQINREDSDYDYVVVYADASLFNQHKKLDKYLPNIHSLQYDDIDNNTQYIFMSESQFYRNLFSGDGNNIADIVLLSDNMFDNPLNLCYSYKIIKGYLGVAKRDLKLHGHNNPKKRFHALRSLYMAETLMNKELPTVDGIKFLYHTYYETDLSPSKEEIQKREQMLRNRLNNMFERHEIESYPTFNNLYNDKNKYNDVLTSILKLMKDSNNIREFKYD